MANIDWTGVPLTGFGKPKPKPGVVAIPEPELTAPVGPVTLDLPKVGSGLSPLLAVARQGVSGMAQGGVNFLEMMAKGGSPDIGYANQPVGATGEATGDWLAGGKPVGPFESGARFIGSSFTPGPNLPVTAALTGINMLAPYAADNWSPSSENGAGQRDDGVDNLKALGWATAATLGLMFAPRLVNSLKGFMPVAQPRPVFNGPTGVVDYSNLGDLARTYDDTSAGMMRQYGRLPNSNPQVAADLQKSYHAHTRAGAERLADSAIKYGKAETSTVRFNVRTSLADLHLTDSPEMREYLNTRNVIDKLNLANQPNTPPAQVRTTINGLDMQTALNRINQLEQAYPQLRQIGQEMRLNIKEARRTMATGRWATIDKREAVRLNTMEPNETGVTHSPDNPTLPTESPTVGAAGYVQKAVRGRLENETKGRTIEAYRKADPRTFREITAKQKADNPSWHVVDVLERGKKKYYATSAYNAAMLKFDPSYNASNASNAFYATKRFFEEMTTGQGNPMFGVVDAGRSYMQGKVTMPTGLSPTILGTVTAIPQQLWPQMARAIASSLDHGSASQLRKIFGDQAIDYLSNGLMMEFDNSRFGALQPHGAFQGSFLQGQVAARKKTGAIINSMPPGPTKQALTNAGNMIWQAWKNTNNAVHNAPQFSVAKRAQKKGYTDSEAAAMARGMAGDPSVKGQAWSEGQRIPIEGKNRVGTRAVQAYGDVVTEFGRQYVPWYNVIVQSSKRVGQAYLDNPTAFVGKVWLYSMLPEAASYLWNASHGDEALDYMQNRRDSYKKSTSYYFHVPGRPYEDGIELPFVPQELAFFKRMTSAGLDLITKRNVMDDQTTLRNAALSYLGVTVNPPLPPLVAAAIAGSGMVPPMNMIGGETYLAPKEPFGDAFTSNLDGAIRALGGGIADLGGKFYAAATHTEGDALAKLQAGAAAAGRRAVEKTPIIRDIFNMHAPAAGSNEVSDETFAKQKSIAALGDYYTISDRGQNLIDTADASKEGTAALAAQGLGDIGSIPGKGRPGDKVPAVGPPPPPPTNPLYKMFMQRVYQDFLKDSTKNDIPGVTRDVVGFQSLWRRHGDLTKDINSIKPVDAGSYVTWQNWLLDHPQIVADLKKEKVEYTNPVAVKNYLNRQRQDVQGVILYFVRQVEGKMSQELGRPIRLEDLNPYAGAQGQAEVDPYGQSMSPSRPAAQ